MRFLIIGLGIYGRNLAIDLTGLGHEVIGADIKPSLVEGIKDYISMAYIIDATDESALSVLPLKNVDMVIVAIGENFGASLKIVALLKKLQVQHIYARAMDEIHNSILEAFGIERILKPEQRAARDLAQEIELGTRVVSMKVDKSSYILKFEIPESLIGENIDPESFRPNCGLTLIAVARPTLRKNIIGVEYDKPEILDITSGSETFMKGDTVVCFGTQSAYKTLFRRIEEI